MRILIVGPQADQWKTEYKEKAIQEIYRILSLNYIDGIIYICGECPYGGIDIWAKEVTIKLGIKIESYPPATKDWRGYSQRNKLMAKICNICYCIVPWNPLVKCHYHYPYFLQHPQNGGCWTRKYANKLGKETHLVVIR